MIIPFGQNCFQVKFDPLEILAFPGLVVPRSILCLYNFLPLFLNSEDIRPINVSPTTREFAIPLKFSNPSAQNFTLLWVFWLFICSAGKDVPTNLTYLPEESYFHYIIQTHDENQSKLHKFGLPQSSWWRVLWSAWFKWYGAMHYKSHICKIIPSHRRSHLTQTLCIFGKPYVFHSQVVCFYFRNIISFRSLVPIEFCSIIIWVRTDSQVGRESHTIKWPLISPTRS